MKPIPIAVGIDQRESAVYHTFCQSVIESSSVPVMFIPLSENLLKFDGQQDGSNAFIYSRYLVPWLFGFQDVTAFFFDGDMIVNDDIADLLQCVDESKAVSCVQHDYKTKHTRKYIGSPMESKNEDYPRKNWSSVLHWNCGHPRNKILTKGFVANAGGRMLHRFEFLKDDEVGELPKRWNWLVGEYEENSNAACHHYTLGAPGFEHYDHCDNSRRWKSALLRANNLSGVEPVTLMKRAWK